MIIKTTVTIILWSLIAVVMATPAATEDSDLFHVTAIPLYYYHVVMEAYKSLPPRLQKAFQGGQIEATLKNDNNVIGAAFAADSFGEPLTIQTTYVRWPFGAETVSFPCRYLKIAARDFFPHGEFFCYVDNKN